MKVKRTDRKPSNALRLPDLDQAKSAVLNSLPSKESRRGYQHTIEEFIAWYCSEPRLSFNRTAVTRYRIHLESPKLARRVRSTEGSLWFVGWHTKLLTLDC